jgi:hypothetical protein
VFGHEVRLPNANPPKVKSEPLPNSQNNLRHLIHPLALVQKPHTYATPLRPYPRDDTTDPLEDVLKAEDVW